MSFRISLLWIVLLLLGVGVWSCEDGDDIAMLQRRADLQKYGLTNRNGNPIDNQEATDSVDVKSYIAAIMEELYFWNDKIPTNVDPTLNVYDYFYAKLYVDDRWSWMETGSDYIQAESGINTRYGMELAQPYKFYNDFSLKVSYVYPNSPIDQSGITRGWTLTAIDNVDVMSMILDGSFYSEIRKSPHNFTFLDLEGIQHSFTISSSTINQPSILIDTIFEPSVAIPDIVSSIGYMNYLSFNQYDTISISETMDRFKAAGVKNLILDLRYNGGGYNSVLQILGSYLAPTSANGEVLLKMIHNSKNASSDKSLLIKRRTNSLDLENLVIITSRATASASEALINGLQPFMNVAIVGDTTLGKPCGMYVIPYPHSEYVAPEYVFYPICFFNVNKNNMGFYINGIVPDALIPDDLFHDFGVEEACINAAIQYIINGSFPTFPIYKNYATRGGEPNYKNMPILKEAKDRANYGTSIMPLNNNCTN